MRNLKVSFRFFFEIRFALLKQDKINFSVSAKDTYINVSIKKIVL